MTRLRATLIACFVIAGTGLAAAQDYPARPVRLIIPFPPGGSNDVVGRLIATKLGDRLGKQVVVDNRSGAGGVIGTEVAAKSPPDGYTLLVISIAHAVNPWLYKLGYDPIKDFAPVGLLAKGANVLVVHPSLRSPTWSGADRARQEAAGRPAIRLRRHRQLPASRRRAVQADDRDRHPARSVQGRRPGAWSTWSAATPR